MMMMTLTFTGLVMLLRICQPLNVIRAVLFGSMAALCITVLAVPFLGNIVYGGVGRLKIQPYANSPLVVIVQAAIPVSNGLIKFCDMFNPADD